MKTRHFLALALLGACTDPAADLGPGGGGGGGGKADNPTSFTNLVTQWELRVGSGGDAVVNDVTVAPDGKMYVTSSFPRWLRKVTPEGKSDTTWGALYPGSMTQRSGYLDTPAQDVFQVGGDRLVAAGGDGALFYLYGYLPNGSPDPDFGTGGRVALPYNDGKPLRAMYDADGARILVVVARAWETSSWFTKGPSKIEIIAYDEATGEASSVGVHDLPSWDNDGTNPASIRELLLLPDGSHVMFVSETIHTPNPSRADVATQWSTIRLAAGQAPVVTRLAVTSYNARVAGFAARAAGEFDVYLNGTVDGLSVAYNEEKLVRISVDEAGRSEVVELGAGLNFSTGCPASVATATHLVFGQSVDRSKGIQFTAYPKSGEPITFESDLPRRCLTGLSVQSDGHIYAGTWDTTNTAWTAQLSSFAPE